MSFRLPVHLLSFFFFTDTATTEIYTLSLHDALPISRLPAGADRHGHRRRPRHDRFEGVGGGRDRKSTRLNSSHLGISYAVFCLKKKKKKTQRNCALSGIYTSAVASHDIASHTEPFQN